MGKKTKDLKRQTRQRAHQHNIYKMGYIVPKEITSHLAHYISGDIIHLLGYYPENPTTERPRPVYKPIYTYPKPTSTFHDQPDRPSWEHETNHISSPSYHPLVVHADDHYGLVDEGGFGGAESDAAFSHHTYNDYKPTSNFNEADDDYRPIQGTHIFYFFCL